MVCVIFYNMTVKPTLQRCLYRSSGLLRSVSSFDTDVSGLYICLILEGQAVQEAWDFKMDPIGSRETSIPNHRTLRMNPEYERIYCL